MVRSWLRASVTQALHPRAGMESVRTSRLDSALEAVVASPDQKPRAEDPGGPCASF
uniref:Uncharacterized protein n=1 Tax=Anguilla anguilla TaxID=7936 RepID=A0A0E9UTF9_ANGAN